MALIGTNSSKDIVVERTYLYITDISSDSHNLPPGVEFKEVPASSLTPSLLHYFYTEVGRDLHWEDRLKWTAEQYRELIANPGFALHILYVDGAPAGYAELITGKQFSSEGVTLEPDARLPNEGTVGSIAYFGLLKEFHGRGLGKLALRCAIDATWKAAAKETGKCAYVWLHTCSLDLQPVALSNYVKRGFRVLGRDSYVHHCVLTGQDLLTDSQH